MPANMFALGFDEPEFGHQLFSSNGIFKVIARLYLFCMHHRGARVGLGADGAAGVFRAGPAAPSGRDMVAILRWQDGRCGNELACCRNSERLAPVYTNIYIRYYSPEFMANRPTMSSISKTCPMYTGFGNSEIA